MHTTKLIAYKGETRIALTFVKKQELINGFKKLGGAKRSTTYYATQLLATGTDLRFLPKLLGYKFTPMPALKVYKSSKVRLIIYKKTQSQPHLERLYNYTTYINELAIIL